MQAIFLSQIRIILLVLSTLPLSNRKKQQMTRLPLYLTAIVIQTFIVIMVEKSYPQKVTFPSLMILHGMNPTLFQIYSLPCNSFVY